MKVTKTVHWPSGPVDACDDHAAKLLRLGGFLGHHVAVVPLGNDDEKREQECQNCVNEANK